MLGPSLTPMARTPIHPARRLNRRKMTPDRTAFDGRHDPSRAGTAPTSRAKTTNSILNLPTVDGRGRWARRRRDLIRILTAGIAEVRAISPADTLLVSHCASLQVEAEQLQVRIVEGDPAIDLEQLTRLANAVSRM